MDQVLMLRVPGATYRIQLHKGFTFEDAAGIADYLKKLGITHVYSSPYLQAAPGSMHGYDVVDHRRVNEELGGAEAHERFCRRLGEIGLGQVLDIVPNHMSLGEQNRYWWDVLENGNNSRYASFFDIDWNSSEERLRDKVLVPILDDQYGRILRRGGIKITRQEGTFTVEAAGQSLPIAPETLSPLLTKAAEYASSDTLNFLAASYGRLPSAEATDRKTILARHRDKLVLQGLLNRLCREEKKVCNSVDRALCELNENLDALDEFLQQQHFRISYWKTADQQLGYRRFFDVNTLIGLRVEREYVFEETHSLILTWLKQGVLDGVRVDHPDGLRDPLQYFQRLRAQAPDAWIIGEKILEPGEWLRSDWPAQGTSGYDFLNTVLGVLVKPDGLEKLETHYSSFTGDNTPFPIVAHEKKLTVAQEALGSDVNRIASLFVDICESNREQRDFTRAEIRRAIREVAACFAIYRTYVVPDRNEIAEQDRTAIGRAAECAKQNRQDIDGLLFDFMRDVLTLKVTGKKESEFVYRFQQFTSPVMAKGVEDTAFYCSNRLTAMNEVGGDPDCDGFSIEYFHTYNEAMQRTFPQTMTTLSTHDTKRSDDVRARLAVLTEMPDEFNATVERWSTHNARYNSESIVDRGTEWFLYQTLVGAWPITAERLRQYMEKAMREAKIRTSWVANNAEYETAVSSFVDSLMNDVQFAADVGRFVAAIAPAGRVNSLTQTLIKYTAPGVPDLYQGGELWDLSLVDPDNRRPVDYQLRRKLLAEVQAMDVQRVMERMDDGLPKLWVIHHALRLRNERPECFGPEAEYTPLWASGPQRQRVLAYLRAEDIVTIAARWSHKAGAWADTTIDLPGGRWLNRLTGRRYAGQRQDLANLLAAFPVALLVRDRES
ncbi:MAG TPA: malto-oligosyltrehalose synthase [Acidobacteriaceae bacterium]|jgi:(1->4)-alpha-D-glucan 1-alpha-D-glucosylmutase|nr:malto-oligosyltrehalose synthase [Acidobacteriaceae bacterium]